MAKNRERRAKQSRGRTGAPDARNGTAPGLAGNGAAQGIKHVDLGKLKFNTVALACDVTFPGVAAFRDLVRNRQALEMLESCERSGCHYIALAGELQKPDAGIIGFAGPVGEHLAEYVFGCNMRLAELGENATLWIVLAPPPISEAVQKVIAECTATTGGVQ